MESLNLIQKIAVWALPVLLAITVHEWAHGYVANRLGDPTARMLGRLSLNPIKHIDPLGTVVLPLVLLVLGGFVFGWAKPVPVTMQNLKHPKTDMAWVAVAGPISNLIMAIGWGLAIQLGSYLLQSVPQIGQPLIYMGIAGITINVILIALNLLPLPPLDGSRIAASFMSNKLAYQYYQLERWGFVILIGLILLGWLNILLSPLVGFFQNLVLTLTGLG